MYIGTPTKHIFTDSTFSKYGYNNIRCYGLNDGFLGVSHSGGTTPYLYSWEHLGYPADSIIPNENALTISGLYAGVYRIYVRDSANCLDSLTLQLHQPDKLLSIPDSIRVSCFQYKDGVASINVSGGTKPYTYWLNSDSIYTTSYTGNYSIDTLKAGSYILNVKDSNNCPSVRDTIVIAEPNKLHMGIDIVRLPYCPDSHDGEISLTVNPIIAGNSYDYSISWQAAIPLTDSLYFNGESNNIYNYTNVSQNLYLIRVVATRVIDQKQCISTDTFNVKGVRGGCLTVPQAFFSDKSNEDFGAENLYWQIRVGSNTEDVNIYYPKAIVSVYDRWGRKVWESSPGYPEDWKGDKVDPGAYYFVINLNHNNRPPITGTVNLLRVVKQ
jgi:hypothetical protein